MKKLHICMVTSALGIGGAETHIVTLAAALGKLGHRVTVLSGGGILAQKSAGVRYLTLPLQDKREFAFCLGVLRKHFRQEKYDVIHTHARFPAFLCHLCGATPMVSTAHWPFSVGFPLKHFPVWGRKVLAVSPDIAAYLTREYGIPEKDILLTVNGIDTEKFRPALPEKATHAGGLVLCHISRFDADRSAAAKALIAAMDILAPLNPVVHLCGDGTEYECLSALAEAQNKKLGRKAILLHGACDNVLPFLQKADLFIGVSRAALEAMAVEKPVILAGDEGFLSLFDTKDPERAEETNFCCRQAGKVTPGKLARAVLLFAGMGETEKREMGRANRAYVKEKYGVSRMVKDALSAYSAVSHTENAVLCGYYGFGNIGDEWLSRAIRERLFVKGYRQVYLLSKRFHLPEAIRALKKGEDFYLGGGNLLQDGTSRRSLTFYLALCAHAARHGARLFLTSAGIGPLSPEGEEKVKKILPLFYSAEVRTACDGTYLGRLYPSLEVKTTCDAALSLPFSAKKSSADTVFFILSSPPYGTVTEYAFLKRIANLAKAFPNEKKEILIFHPEDTPFCRRAARFLSFPLSSPDEEEALRLFSNARAVFSCRLHAGIGALAAGVPAFLFPFSSKNIAFAQDVANMAEKCGKKSPVLLLSPFDTPFSFTDIGTEDVLYVKKALLCRADWGERARHKKQERQKL